MTELRRIRPRARLDQSHRRSPSSTMPSDDGKPEFACRCLNVRLFKGQLQQDNQTQTQPDAAGDYQSMYVGEDGIRIAHTELTLRIRSSISVEPGNTGSRLTQHTLVTCLICNTAVYRVQIEVASDTDAKEGPVLPTEDWAERDTLTNKSGWVDVHIGTAGCISGEEIERIKSSSSYSPHFSVALPVDPLILSTSPPSALVQTKFEIPASHSFLPSLPPFLPPPPFTPSHPIFLHLSAIALTSANAARDAAEEQIKDFAKRQLAQVEETETQLKTQLEHLWRNVRGALKKAEGKGDADMFPRAKKRRSMSPGSHSSSVLRGLGSPVVRTFTPSTYSGSRPFVSSANHRSALSASLATTSFHHPRAQRNQTNGQINDSDVAPIQPSTPSPPPYASNPSSPRNSSGSGSDSVTNVSRSLRRNMDAVNDTAVTYRWYAIEEQEAARQKARKKAKEEKQEKAKEVAGQAGTDVVSGTAEETERVQKQTISQTQGVEGDESANKGKDSPRKGDGKKGRKVTFDVQPNVVTIKRDINAEKEEDHVQRNGYDLIFELDASDTEALDQSDDNKMSGGTTPNETPQPILSLYEAPERPSRVSRRSTEPKNSGLPQSFAVLRPSSLPAPSHVRPPLRLRSDDAKSPPEPQLASPSSTSNSRRMKNGKRRTSSESLSDSTFSPHQKDLLKLVGADMPSHRGAWSRDSDAWKIFGRSEDRSATIVEEDEGDSSRGPGAPSTNGTVSEEANWSQYRMPDLASSLPVSIAPISQVKSSGVPSLQPKTSLTDRQGVLVPPIPPLPTVTEEEDGGKNKSAVASRKEAYAERDRKRDMDPGLLDFVQDGEDEEESPDHDEPEVDQDRISSSKGRQHALKIIRAHNAVPAEGLWRSLAS